MDSSIEYCVFKNIKFEKKHLASKKFNLMNKLIYLLMSTFSLVGTYPQL